MNPDLEELYQQVILDHSKRPRNYGELISTDAATPVVRIFGDNPSCGDEVEIFVQFDDTGYLQNLQFIGQGCAISQASASMMTVKAKGKNRAELQQLLHQFSELMRDSQAVEQDDLGEVQVLQGVWKFPQRVKCATLAWRALEKALQN